MNRAQAPSTRARPLVPPGERVLHDSRPGVSSIVVHAARSAALLLVPAALAWMLGDRLVALAGTLDRGLGAALGVWLGWAIAGLVVCAVGRVIWSALDWWCRRYVLTEVRVIAARGVFRTVRFDVPLRRVQHLAVTRSILERVFGLGTVCAASAGTDGHEVVWRSVRRPDSALSAIRARADAVSRGGDGPDPMPVIGLVGGVGSGKSAAAAAFERLGCVISDSDRAVREALARPEVAETLSEWWGSGVLDGRGGVDRKRVADIVFENDHERRRLEGLIHPLVRTAREALIEQARARGAAGVVVDAPLLFEAGVDAECDAVVFVDAPRDVRMGRVRAGRGWDEDELDRREKAQMALEEKRRRSDYVVVNHGTLEELDSRVARVLAAVRKHARDHASDRGTAPGPV